MHKIVICHQMHPEVKGLGDEIALRTIAEGIRQCGVSCLISDAISDWIDADFVFLSNTAYNLNPYYHALSLHKKRFGLIAFHQDFAQFDGPATAFIELICQYLGKPMERIEASPKPLSSLNSEIFKHATLCIANSRTEANTIQRDYPKAPVQIIPWTTGILEKTYDYSDAFLKLIGLAKGEYILQIGRLCPRKNQMATILATRNLDIPLVLLSNHLFLQHRKWLPYWIQAILSWRKAPTFIISRDLEPLNAGPLKIIRPEEDLSTKMIVSAYQNAGLYLHPAFQELPGFVYLEAAKLGIPTVASTWTTVKDYFLDTPLDDRIVYSEPHNINRIEKLVKENFGKSYPPSDHPAFHRSPKDIGKEIISYSRL